MTVFELALRSMRQNVKHYYLYFFALIFTTGLYFIFATLQQDPAVQERTGSSAEFSAAFQVAGILLIVIAAIFTVYANRIFLKRRSRELGLYQLIGLSKGWVVRYLIIENIVLGLSALILGIASGALLSRLFLMILLRLIGLDEVVGLSFSIPATIQTALVFLMVIGLTSFQMAATVYRSTLLNLFQADREQDYPSQPRALVAAVCALLGIALIGYGYWLSDRMINQLLFLNMLLVLASTILGTYLLYRVTIGWILYRVRKHKNGHLGLTNSLSLAPLMHRMKDSAGSLTLITVLSAMTITLVASAYSMYYSVERDARWALPYDYLFENNEQAALSFQADLERQGLAFEQGRIDAIRLVGNVYGDLNNAEGTTRRLLLLPAEQLQHIGDEVPIPPYGEVVYYNARAIVEGLEEIGEEIQFAGNEASYRLTDLAVSNLVNYNVSGIQLLASEATIQAISEQAEIDSEIETVRFDTFQMEDWEGLEQSSTIFATYVADDPFWPDFYSEYKTGLQIFGLLIFIAAFLGLAFLISTGSILYFKQMTEAEQERQSFKTLRQLGFDTGMIMRGIIRKQAFVFLIPLVIGILHAIFAVKAASILVISDITVPTVIAMTAYAGIYFIFAILTIGYYRNIVRRAMS
ncbi:ABC transporter permease [Paenibacillus daejeonensis]|uniref:ABC transporter permease n=1 Tax=Paenibacillus daejeonensis TaxID=135193 RepID=UPI00036AF5F8|nr:FtsX-like permease family protein [Paenibacillus daejeonensis]